MSCGASGSSFLMTRGDLLQLRHQVVFVVQPPGGVDQQDVRIPLPRLFQRAVGEAGGIGAMLAGDEMRARAVRPDLKLLHRGGAEGVARRHDHAFALCPVLLGQFANGRGLADAVDAHHQHHVRPVPPVDLQRVGHRLQHFANVAGEVLAHLLVRHLPVELRPGQVGGQLGGGGGAEVGHDQDVFQLLQGFVVQPAFRGKDASDAAGQTLGRAGQAGFQAAEKAAAFRFVSHGWVSPWSGAGRQRR